MEYHVAYRQGGAFTAVPAVELTHCGWTEETEIHASAQLCWDEEALYVRMTAVEQAIRATLTGPLEQVCNDSCLEFFFAPWAEDDRYFNFEWNKLGALSLSLGRLRPTRVRQIPKKAAELFGFSSFDTADGWGITYRIPLTFLRTYDPDYRFTEAAGNFYKCGDETEVPHFLSWAPMTTDTPDFHRRGDFGKLIFDPKP